MVSSQHHNSDCDSSSLHLAPTGYSKSDIFNITHAPISEPSSDSVKDFSPDAVKVWYIVRFWLVHLISLRTSVLETAKEANKVDKALMNLCMARRRVATVQIFFCLDRLLAHPTCRREHSLADSAESLNYLLGEHPLVDNGFKLPQSAPWHTLEPRFDTHKVCLTSRSSGGSTTFCKTPVRHHLQ